MRLPSEWLVYIDSQLLIWTVLQITLVALAAYVIVRFAGNRTTPKTRAMIAMLGLICLTALPCIGISRMYEWSWGDWIARLMTSQRNSSPTQGPAEFDLLSASSAKEPVQSFPQTWWDQALINANELFLSRPIAREKSLGESNPLRDESQSALRGSTLFWLSSILIVSVFLGMARVAVGFWLVRCLRRSSIPLDDPRLDAEIDACAKELGASRGISISVSSSIGSPAVVGWISPLLLLPSTWRSWTPEERRAVIAHELAHIQRNDYLITSLAQIVAAIHFYHPIVHALVSRLRLEQELAADLMASRLVGGAQRYIEIVAGLALRQPVVRTPGPAQAFLPTRQMFVRRLEMLRFQSFSSRRLGRCYMVVGSIAIVTLTLFASGLRPVVGYVEAANSAGVKGALDEPQQTDLLSLIPADSTEGVIDIDVPKLLASPAVQKLLKSYPGFEKNIPFDLKKLERVLIFVPNLVGGKDSPLVLLRFTDGVDLSMVEKRQIDDRTYLIGGTEETRSKVVETAVDSKFKALLSRHDGGAVRIAGKMGGLQQSMSATEKEVDPMMVVFAPLWNNVETFSIGMNVDKELRLDGRLDSDDAKRVSTTLLALKNLGDNVLESFGNRPDRENGNGLSREFMSEGMVERLKSLMKSITIKTNESDVQVAARVESFEEAASVLIAPAIQSARTAAMRTQSASNMKQIMIAIHSYETDHKHLPSAVIRDPKTGVERSWRVEILPYLNRQDLYDLYRTDEPWDSVVNQEVLKKMPSVFALPGTVGSDTPYLAVASLDGGLTLSKDGKAPRLEDATDGLSGTAFVVETNPMVPWTKPVDATELEGVRNTKIHNGFGFHVGLGDGSVVFITSSIDPDVWKAITTRSGGEVDTSK